MPLRTRLPQPVVNRTVSLPTTAASTTLATTATATATATATSITATAAIRQSEKNAESGSRLMLRRRAMKRARASVLVNAPSASADFYLTSKNSLPINCDDVHYQSPLNINSKNNNNKDDDDDEDDDDDDNYDVDVDEGDEYDDNDVGVDDDGDGQVDHDESNGSSHNDESTVDILAAGSKSSLQSKKKTNTKSKTTALAKDQEKAKVRTKSGSKTKDKDKDKENDKEKERTKGRRFKTKGVMREQEKKKNTKGKGMKNRSKMRRVLPFTSQVGRDAIQNDKEEDDHSLQLHISAFTPLSRRARHEPQLIAVFIRPASEPLSSHCSAPTLPAHSNHSLSSSSLSKSTTTTMASTDTNLGGCQQRLDVDPAMANGQQQDYPEDLGRLFVGSWDVWRPIAVVTALPAVVDVPLDGIPLNSVILRLSFHTLKPSRHVGNATTPLSRLVCCPQSASCKQAVANDQRSNLRAGLSRGAVVLPVSLRDSDPQNFAAGAGVCHQQANSSGNVGLNASAVVFVRAAFNSLPSVDESPCFPICNSNTNQVKEARQAGHVGSPTPNVREKFPPGLMLSVRTAPSMRRDTRHTAAVALSVVIEGLSMPPLPAGRVALPRRGNHESAARIVAPPNVLWFGLQQVVHNANSDASNNKKGAGVLLRIEWLGSAKRGVALVHGSVDIAFDKLAHMQNGHLVAVHWAHVAGAIPMSPSVVVDSIALRDGSWFLDLSLTR